MERFGNSLDSIMEKPSESPRDIEQIKIHEVGLKFLLT